MTDDPTDFEAWLERTYPPTTQPAPTDDQTAPSDAETAFLEFTKETH